MRTPAALAESGIVALGLAILSSVLPGVFTETCNLVRIPMDMSRVSHPGYGAPADPKARSRCQRVLGNVAHGRHPLHGIDGADLLTLGRFIDETYAPWARTNRPRTATNTLQKLEIHLGTWFAEPLTAITLERLELWKGRRLNSGRRPTTVLRDIFTLSSMLSRAVKCGKLAENPIRRLKSRASTAGPAYDFSDAARGSTLREHCGSRRSNA